MNYQKLIFPGNAYFIGMDPMATPFVQKTERLTECHDTFELVTKFAFAHGVSPTVMRATSQELCVATTQQFGNELLLRRQTDVLHEMLCEELLCTIDRDTDVTMFVNGEEFYVGGE